jgi:hypothetical protein
MSWLTIFGFAVIVLGFLYAGEIARQIARLAPALRRARARRNLLRGRRSSAPIFRARGDGSPMPLPSSLARDVGKGMRAGWESQGSLRKWQ